MIMMMTWGLPTFIQLCFINIVIDKIIGIPKKNIFQKFILLKHIEQCQNTAGHLVLIEKAILRNIHG